MVAPGFPSAQIGLFSRMTGISCTVHVAVMSLRYPEAMKSHRPRRCAIDLYMRELDSCPPLTAAEEQELCLRMLRLRERLAVLLGGLPEPQRRVLLGVKATDARLPFAMLESMVAALRHAAEDRTGTRLAVTARRAAVVLGALTATRSTFVTRNLRLTFHFARRLAGRSTPLADLIQAGNVGLLEAVDRFDPRRGTRFSTYAGMYITRSVFRTVPRLSQPVHVPEYQRRLKSRLRDSRRSLVHELGRMPTLEETAARAHIEAAKARKILQASLTILELDGPAPGLERGSLADTMPGDDGMSVQRRLIAGDLQRLLDDLLPALDPRMRLVLRLRYGLDGEREHTLQEIGEVLRLSRERVRQLEEEAVETLRARLRRLALRGLPSVPGRPARRLRATSSRPPAAATSGLAVDDVPPGAARRLELDLPPARRALPSASPAAVGPPSKARPGPDLI